MAVGNLCKKPNIKSQRLSDLFKTTLQTKMFQLNILFGTHSTSQMLERTRKNLLSSHLRNEFS